MRNLYPDQTIPRREDAIPIRERRPYQALHPTYLESPHPGGFYSDDCCNCEIPVCSFKDLCSKINYNWAACVQWRLNEKIANLHDDFGDEGFACPPCVNDPYFPCEDCMKNETLECSQGSGMPVCFPTIQLPKPLRYSQAETVPSPLMISLTTTT